jgi:hypothetical protein
LFILEPQPAISGAREAVDRARVLVQKVGGGLDTSTLDTQIKQLSTAMGNIGNAGSVISGLSAVIAAVTKLKNDAQTRSQSLTPIVFLLRAFLAINVPGHGAAPSPDVIKAALDQLRLVMSDNFHAVFGEVGDAAIFVDFAEILERQLHVEADMAAAGATASSMVPSTETDMKAYFSALAKSENDKVFDAYRTFAAAFFFHKAVATAADLRVAVPDLLAQPASITGTKPLVCTVYASIGGQTLGLAGANTDAFIVGIRADDKTLRAGATLDDAHALCKVARNGKTVFVSNGEIVSTQEEGIGPEAVAWTNKTARLFVGRGKTMIAAVDDAMKKVTKRMATLSKP